VTLAAASSLARLLFSVKSLVAAVVTRESSALIELLSAGSRFREVAR
jgi:hypothetical protein